MRSAQFAVALCVALLNTSVWGQQVAAPPPAPQDPQAVSVLSQAFAVAGGTAAYTEIADYTATGTITYFGQNPGQGAATISGRGASELRIDATLASGSRSVIVNGGQTTTSDATGIQSQRAIQAPMMTGNYVLPYRELAAVFNNPQFSLTYEGVIQIDGHSLHEIQAQRVLPGQNDPNGSIRAFHTVKFFIDTSTLLLNMTTDTLPRRGAPRTTQYSNYQTVSGVMVPFSINETNAGEQASTLNLSQINFNVGLQDATFDLGVTAQ